MKTQAQTTKMGSFMPPKLGAIFYVLYFLMSCQTQQEVKPFEEKTPVLGDDVYVEKGMLHFKNVKDYIRLIEEPVENERDILVKNLDGLPDYKSLKSKYRAILSARENSTARTLEEDPEDLIEEIVAI